MKSLLCLILSTILLVACAPLPAETSKGAERAHVLAAKLGQTPENLLTEYDACTDLGSVCSFVVVFETSQNLSQIETQVRGLGRVIGRTPSQVPEDQKSISKEIGVKLEIAGENPKSNAVSQAAREAQLIINWQVGTTDGKPVFVQFYPTSAWPHIYKFRDRILLGNIVDVSFVYYKE